jgi:hypothetical protein
MRNRELILSLPNGDLELYSHVLSLYLDIVILSIDQHRWYSYFDKIS